MLPVVPEALRCDEICDGDCPSRLPMFPVLSGVTVRGACERDAIFLSDELELARDRPMIVPSSRDDALLDSVRVLVEGV